MVEMSKVVKNDHRL